MKKTRYSAKITEQPGSVPEWVLLFAAGWVELADGLRFLVDKTAFDLVKAGVSENGNEIHVDYEHASVKEKGVLAHGAPAAGWIRELVWEEGIGIKARVEWTAVAATYLENREYRYFSPVFYIRKRDRRLCGLDSVALTNRPRTRHLQPIVAKLPQEKETIMDKKELITALGLPPDAQDEAVFKALASLGLEPKMQESPKEPDNQETKEVIPTAISAALGLGETAEESEVVASIHALKQTEKNSVSLTDFNALKAQIAKRDATDAVAAAMTRGKITPDQKDWAMDYAQKDPKGFAAFIAKAPVVIPVEPLPGKKPDNNDKALTEADLAVASLMGVLEEDLKKYGGKEVTHV